MGYYNQFFCKTNERYSIVIEEENNVAYAYLLDEDNLVGDVWLYNSTIAPKEVDWSDRSKMPFLNPQPYLKNIEKFDSIRSDSELNLEWKNEDKNVEVKIYIRNELIGILSLNNQPGWSTLVLTDGPLAKVYSSCES